jgi:hypothetical protein
LANPATSLNGTYTPEPTPEGIGISRFTLGIPGGESYACRLILEANGVLRLYIPEEARKHLHFYG